LGRKKLPKGQVKKNLTFRVKENVLKEIKQVERYSVKLERLIYENLDVIKSDNKDKID